MASGAALAAAVQAAIDGKVYNDDPDVKRIKVIVLEDTRVPLAHAALTSDFGLAIGQRPKFTADPVEGPQFSLNNTMIAITTGEPRSEFGMTKPKFRYVADSDIGSNEAALETAINTLIKEVTDGNTSITDMELIRITWNYGDPAVGLAIVPKDCYFLLFN